MLLLILTLIGTASANTLEDHAKILLHVKDIRSLRAKSYEIKERKKNEVACEFELASKIIPRSCYKLRLTTEKLATIDEACIQAAVAMKDEVPLKGLSSRCSVHVHKKNLDLKYMKVEQNPESVLNE